MEKFIIDVSYSQIAVFNSELENPFNDWTDQHVLQGFSWREESGSFKTLVFETGYSDDLCWSRFTFIPDGSQISEILIADNELDATNELIMHADQA